MRYLLISDVHGNLEALEAVLADAPPYDAIINLGDLIGYGPNPNEVVERVRQLPLGGSLAGNHDLAALGRIDLELFNPVAGFAARWTAGKLRPEARGYMDTLEPTGRSAHLFLAHGSPLDPVWEYMETAWQGRENFGAFAEQAALVGHTHVPRVFELADGNVKVWRPEDGRMLTLEEGKRYIINPGGVGQPRDGDPRAAYALYDTADGTVSFYRVTYPVPVTQKKILDAGLPSGLASRLSRGM